MNQPCPYQRISPQNPLCEMTGPKMLSNAPNAHTLHLIEKCEDRVSQGLLLLTRAKGPGVEVSSVWLWYRKTHLFMYYSYYYFTYIDCLSLDKHFLSINIMVLSHISPLTNEMSEIWRCLGNFHRMHYQRVTIVTAPALDNLPGFMRTLHRWQWGKNRRGLWERTESFLRAESALWMERNSLSGQ